VRKRPAQKCVRRIAQCAWDEIRKLTPEQRLEMLMVLRGLSQTNCWWTEYQIREGLMQLVEFAIQDDKLEATRKLAKKMTLGEHPTRGRL
jgi:hypothetical protein